MSLHIFADMQELSHSAANMVVETAASAVAQRGRFTVAISGGSLPKLVFPPLVNEPLRSQVDWASWHVFWADERCVPLDHQESSYRLAKETLFEHVDIPTSQIYTIDPNLSPSQAANAYQTTLANVFDLSLQSSSLPQFDLILLGMGPDGHTASLFPGHPLLNETERWVAPIIDSPKPPPERITLTLPVINNARQVAFIATGTSKADLLPQVLDQSTSEFALPAGLVQPTNGQLHWFVDTAAAMNLNN